MLIIILNLLGNGFFYRHQLAESYFVLWRLTHNPKYREHAWQLAKAIERYCKTESGKYARSIDLQQTSISKDDYQPPNFLSGTLKYLYLTFTDDTVLPLDQWTFNAYGHPLPICGKNEAYPKEWCIK